MLGNTARFSFNDVGFSNGIEECRFSMVNMTHNHHDRRSLDDIWLGGFFAFLSHNKKRPPASWSREYTRKLLIYKGQCPLLFLFQNCGMMREMFWRKQVTKTERVYLDWAAATPLLPAAKAAMGPWLSSEWGNPSAIHTEGQQARHAVEE